MNTADVHSTRHGPVQVAKLEAPALCIGYALGNFGAGAIPLWVAAVIKAGSLTTSEVGWLASGELLLLAVSVLATSAWAGHLGPRRVAAFSALAVAAANIVALIPEAQALVIGRLLSGSAMGALLASITGVAARRPDAQRVLALMQAAMVILTSAAYFMSPILIGHFGPARIFAFLAGLGIITMSAALMGLPTFAVVPITVMRAAGAQTLAPLIGCVALAVVSIGQNTVATYIFTIGNGLGLDARTMGTVLAIAVPLALLGPFAAHRLGERVGLLRPLIFGQLLLAINILFLVRAPSPIMFCFFTAALGLLWTFCVPYAVAFLGRLEASGRLASAAQAFIMVGSAVGPALGGKMIGSAGFQTLAIVASSCIAVAIALFAAAASMTDVKISALASRG